MQSLSHFDLVQERYPQNNAIKVYNVLLEVLKGKIHTINWEQLIDADWETFAQIASHEGVAGCVYWYWKNNASVVDIPPMILGKLGAEYFHNQAQNMQIQKELIQRIGPTLTKFGEKIIVTKGAVLAKALYPDPGMRSMVDIDCLAAQEKIASIKKALSSIGYSDGMDHIQLDWMGFQKHHIVLQSLNPVLVPIELHFQLTSVNLGMFLINIDWFLENIQPAFAEDTIQSIWTFTPSAHLLHLAIHLILHHSEGASQLKHFFDIHLILERWNDFIDWDELTKVAQDMNLDYILWTAIKSSSDRFGTLLPPLFDQPPSGKSVRPYIKFANSRKRQYPKTPVERYLRRLIGLPIGLKISGIFRFIFPKPEYMRFRYRLKPNWLWFLSYPLRWAIGLKQLVSVFFR